MLSWTIITSTYVILKGFIQDKCYSIVTVALDVQSPGGFHTRCSSYLASDKSSVTLDSFLLLVPSTCKQCIYLFIRCLYLQISTKVISLGTQSSRVPKKVVKLWCFIFDWKISSNRLGLFFIKKIVKMDGTNEIQLAVFLPIFNYSKWLFSLYLKYFYY